MKIDKGIPIPIPRRKWPFSDMEIGDSFEIDSDYTPSQARNAAGSFVRRNRGLRFAIRGRRVWRTS